MVTNNTGIDFDADVAMCVSDLGDTFTHGSTSYACVISPVAKGTTLEVDGYMHEITVEIVVQTSLFSGTRPAANDNIVIAGSKYRIVRVTTDEADAAMNIDLEDDTA